MTRRWIRTRPSSVGLGLAVGLLLAASPVSAASGSLDVETVKGWCSADPEREKELYAICLVYLRGLVEGAVQQAAVSGGKLYFCPTDTNNMGFGDAPAYFVKYVSEHTARERTDIAPAAFTRALLARMPCPK